MEIEVEGLSIFDPRDGKHKISDNPALIMLDLMNRGIIKANIKPKTLEAFIKQAADFCDAPDTNDIALRALLATIHDEWSSIDIWAIQASYFDKIPSAVELKVIIDAMKGIEKEWDVE